jgi:hypothetical protein
VSIQNAQKWTGSEQAPPVAWVAAVNSHVWVVEWTNQQSKVQSFIAAPLCHHPGASVSALGGSNEKAAVVQEQQKALAHVRMNSSHIIANWGPKHVNDFRHFGCPFVPPFEGSKTCPFTKSIFPARREQEPNALEGRVRKGLRDGMVAKALVGGWEQHDC